MNPRRRIMVGVVAVSVTVIVGCLAWPYLRYLGLGPIGRGVHGMDQNANVTVTFYGQVVDDAGAPIAGASIAIQVHAINKGWAYSSKGAGARDQYRNFVISSDERGQFSFNMTGDYVRIEQIAKTGYRWLYDKYTESSAKSNNTFFRVETEGNPGPYLPEAGSPALFVLVRNGVSAVTARPSRGGAEMLREGRVANRPVWPKEPSLTDVSYVPSGNLNQR